MKKLIEISTDTPDLKADNWVFNVEQAGKIQRRTILRKIGNGKYDFAQIPEREPVETLVSLLQTVAVFDSLLIPRENINLTLEKGSCYEQSFRRLAERLKIKVNDAGIGQKEDKLIVDGGTFSDVANGNYKRYLGTPSQRSINVTFPTEFIRRLCKWIIEHGSLDEIVRKISSIIVNKENNFHNKFISVATFDSGFGGVFIAKSIEKIAKKINKDFHSDFSIEHIGDTINAPYGEKTEKEIADLTTSGVEHALRRGAKYVFIGCNTACTQYDTVINRLKNKYSDVENRVISIIEETVSRLKEQIEQKLHEKKEVHIGILATPATVQNQVYPQKIAAAIGGTLKSYSVQDITQERWSAQKGAVVTSKKHISEVSLPNGKKVFIHQYGPGNWVNLIEKGADDSVKVPMIKKDLEIFASSLPEQKYFDIVGKLYTHYQLFSREIKGTLYDNLKVTDETNFVKQGPIMANVFAKMMQKERLKRRRTPLNRSKVKVRINITGENLKETRELVEKSFPSFRPSPVERIPRMQQSIDKSLSCF